MSKTRPIADIVADLFASKGYARIQATSKWQQVWSDAAGATLAAHSRAGEVKRGVLEVMVTNSTMLQEITFQKAKIVKRLGQLAPDQAVRDLKLRVGAIV